MTWASFTPYVMLNLIVNVPIQNSFALHTVGINAEISDTYDSTSMLFRMTNLMPPLLLKMALPMLYNDDNFPEIMNGRILLEHYRSTFYGYGFEGFSDPVQ